MNNKEIIKTIFDQLKSTAGFSVLASWGMNQVMGINSDSEDKNPILQFKVQGYHFKGHVRIEYSYGTDTYTVHFGKFIKSKGEWINEESVSNVYFDEMAYLIDQKVEYIEAYNKTA